MLVGALAALKKQKAGRAKAKERNIIKTHFICQ